MTPIPGWNHVNSLFLRSDTTYAAFLPAAHTQYGVSLQNSLMNGELLVILVTINSIQVTKSISQEKEKEDEDNDSFKDERS